MLVVVFVLARASGDTAALMLPDTATQADIQAMRKYLGTDRTLPVQLLNFSKRMVHGDLGNSTRFRNDSVVSLIAKRLPKTAQLAGLAVAISVTLAVVLGVAAAVFRNSPIDLAVRLLGIMGQSMPSFWIGIVGIHVFAVQLHLLPASGSSSVRAFILPVVVLSWGAVAGMMRLLRAQMLEVLGTDYVRTARAKGLSPRVVIFRHALRNGLIPVLTVAGLFFANLLHGSVIIESVFAWPGLGQLAQQSVVSRDFPLLQGIVLFSAAVFVASNLMVDLLYPVIDPRVNLRR